MKSLLKNKIQGLTNSIIAIKEINYESYTDLNNPKIKNVNVIKKSRGKLVVKIKNESKIDVNTFSSLQINKNNLTYLPLMSIKSILKGDYYTNQTGDSLKLKPNEELELNYETIATENLEPLDSLSFIFFLKDINSLKNYTKNFRFKVSFESKLKSNTVNNKKNVFQEIGIGKQIWATKNLDVTSFRNGDPILEANSISAWVKAASEKEPAWCYYNFDQENGKKYGKIYNWYAVNYLWKLAPEGWHIPSSEEWQTLFTFHGGKQNSGSLMKTMYGWKNRKNGKWGNGGYQGGFNGLPGGGTFNDGSSFGIEEIGGWWSSTEFDEYNANCILLANTEDGATIEKSGKSNGMSIRCIKD